MKLKDFDNFVNENVRDAMKPVSSGKVLEIRNKVLDDILDKITNMIKIIRFVAQDYQLDTNSPDYMGFLNMSSDGFSDPKMGECLKDFVYMYKNGYKGLIDELLIKIHMKVEGNISDEEVIIYDMLNK